MASFDAGTTNVKMVYQSVIDDVIRNIRDAAFDEGYDDHFLKELKTTWESKLHAIKSFQNDDKQILKVPMQQQQQQQRMQYVIQQQQHMITATSPMNLLHASVRVAPQAAIPAKTTTATTQVINIKNMNINNQTDGPNDGSSDDDVDDEEEEILKVPLPEEDDDDDYDDDDDSDDDSDKTFNDEDPKPINSGDDQTDEETPEVFDTDNVIVCHFEKITKAKCKWKFNLKNGVMNIEGRDFLFLKATGDAEW